MPIDTQLHRHENLVPSFRRSVPRAQLLEVVAGGALAPSGDNCQPWRVRLTATGFELFFVKERAVSLLDARHVASRISCGAFLESASIRASALGLHAAITIVDAPVASELSLWATVELERRTVAADPLAAYLAMRHTNRHEYDGSTISELDAATLGDIRLGDARVELLTARDTIADIARSCELAERCRAANQAAHEELHSWLRWTPEEAIATRDGLDIRTLGVSAIEQQLMKSLAPWARMKWAAKLGADRANGAYARRLVQSASAIGAVVVSTDSTSAELEAGRVMQRAWLAATQRGLAFSPIAALPLMIERVDHPGTSPLAVKHAETLNAIRGDFRRDCRAMGKERIVFLFRVGRAAPMAVRSMRLGIEQLLLPETQNGSKAS